MAFDVFSPTIGVNDAIFGPGTVYGTNAAPVTSSGFDAVANHYSVGVAQGFHGSYNDFFTFDPSVNIDAFTLAGFSNHATLESLSHGVASFTDIGPVLTFTAQYHDGGVGSPFGGLVLGANSDGVLVQQINGFFDLGTLNPTTGGEQFVGTLTHNYQVFMNTTNLSLKSGTAPTLPLVFTPSALFVAAPEPSSAMMFAVAAVALVAARQLRKAVRAI